MDLQRRRGKLKGHFWWPVAKRTPQGISVSIQTVITHGIVWRTHINTPKPQLLSRLYRRLHINCWLTAMKIARRHSLSGSLYLNPVRYTSCITQPPVTALNSRTWGESGKCFPRCCGASSHREGKREQLHVSCRDHQTGAECVFHFSNLTNPCTITMTAVRWKAGTWVSDPLWYCNRSIHL